MRRQDIKLAYIPVTTDIHTRDTSECMVWSVSCKQILEVEVRGGKNRHCAIACVARAVHKLCVQFMGKNYLLNHHMISYHSHFEMNSRVFDTRKNSRVGTQAASFNQSLIQCFNLQWVGVRCMVTTPMVRVKACERRASNKIESSTYKYKLCTRFWWVILDWPSLKILQVNVGMSVGMCYVSFFLQSAVFIPSLSLSLTISL